MGHSDIATTIHYLRRDEMSDSSAELARAVLSGKSAV